MALSTTPKPDYTREEFAEILRECGFQPKFFSKPDRYPEIFCPLDGASFIVTLCGGSHENNDNNIMKEAMFVLQTQEETTLALVNEWNLNDRILGQIKFVTASCFTYDDEDPVGDLSASLKIILEDASPAHILRQVEIWRTEASQILQRCALKNQTTKQ
jgi:hypothetical protein